MYHETYNLDNLNVNHPLKISNIQLFLNLGSFPAVCQPSCQNGGTCIAPNQCICDVTYTGPTCAVREFSLQFC